MSPTPYTLPQIDFIGGTTQFIVCDIFSRAGNVPLDLSGSTAKLSLISYINKFGTPALTKDMDVAEAEEGAARNTVTAILDSADTKQLYGKYIYQINITDGGGVVEIRQGIMHIFKNIHTGI